MLFSDFDHKWADIILHKDPRDSMAACSMVYHAFLSGNREKMCFFHPTATPNDWKEQKQTDQTLKRTRSVTEYWCVSAETLYVLSLVGTMVIKYWNMWLSTEKMWESTTSKSSFALLITMRHQTANSTIPLLMWKPRNRWSDCFMTTSCRWRLEMDSVFDSLRLHASFCCRKPQMLTS